MDQKQRNRRDFWQNITIAVLSLTAVFLFSQTQLFQLGSSTLGQHLPFLMDSSAQTGTAADSSSVSALTAPVHVAVSGAYGRYGSMALITSDDEFRPLGDLLNEALGSARSYTACTREDFLQALDTTSVYYDFLSSLPVSILADMTGTTIESELQAQRMVLSASEDLGVLLYLWDPDGNYQYCGTAVSRGDLESTVSRYELGNAVFAFELAEEEGRYTTIDPCSLFLADTLPQLPVLQAEHHPSDSDALLSALHFNPRTNYRYPESDGTEVVVEGERSLRIRPDGTIQYRSGGETVLTIDSAAPDAPTLQEAAAEASALLRQLLSTAGDALLYLQHIHQSDTATTLQFGYHINGIPVRFYDGSPAAEVTLDGSTVSTLSLNYRQYTATGELSMLLPLRQALAIAAGGSGAELSIGYADNGSDKLPACWLTD